MTNLFNAPPINGAEETFNDLINQESVRIEHIISPPHATLNTDWYDQDDNEWVMVLKGLGILEFEGGQCITLQPGDYINIPAHQKHRVIQISDHEATIWLAVFYSSN